jgi:hypothetical protein
MKILSDTNVTKADLDAVKAAYRRRLRELRVIVYGGAVLNLLTTAFLVLTRS